MKNTNMMKTKQRIGFTLMAGACLLGLPVMAAGGPPAKAAAVPPDLPQGGKPDNRHRWTLGSYLRSAKAISYQFSSVTCNIGSAGIWNILEHQHD